MLNIAFNEDIDQDNEWHFMPVKLNHSQNSVSEAKVSQYFKPSIKEDPYLSASFQGHLLKGVRSEEKDLYKAICYQPEPESKDREMVITERVGKAIDWRKDISWQKYEGHLGTIKKYEIIQKALLEE